MTWLAARKKTQLNRKIATLTRLGMFLQRKIKTVNKRSAALTPKKWLKSVLRGVSGESGRPLGSARRRKKVRRMKEYDVEWEERFQ